MQWKHTTIRTNASANTMVELFHAYPPDYAAFDTETTGLHIIYDKPFLFQFGWINMEHQLGYTFVVDIEQQPILAKQVINYWHTLVKDCPVYAAHNVKYDLHMLLNIGITYEEDNITDSMFYIRGAMDNIPERKGGPPLGLKPYCARYVDKTAKGHDKMIQSARSKIAKDLNKKLQIAFNKLGKPPGMKSWTKKYIDETFEDICFDIHDLEPGYVLAYMQWKDTIPQDILRNMRLHTVVADDIPYNLVDRELVIRYGHQDIVLVLKLLMKTIPIIDVRKTWNLIELENKCIYPFLRMERVGFKTDVDYLNQSIEDTRAYISQQRSLLEALAGQPLKVTQHAKVKEVLFNQYQINLNSTGADVLNMHVARMKKELPGHPAIEFIDTLQELRTLEKWISVYMTRFQIDLRKGNSDRIYTQINQVGTVSGRVTSDFQQFPKSAMLDKYGNELFHPRRMILSEGNGIVYLDYSQIELRLQALYTILVGDPDTNLCRAYMPYKCYKDDADGTYFDYHNPDHVNGWNSGDWLQEEDGQPWTPTDVHGATTKAAFHIDEDHERYKELRYFGKRVNFAKNYGCQRAGIEAMFPELTSQEITAIDNGYYIAFPGVKSYQDYCFKVANMQAYAVNLEGIKYYGVSGHNLINMLIQGSGAHFLKKKIIEVDDLLKNFHSRFQMNIHDELSFIWDSRDPFVLFYTIKEIMEQWDGCLVPIVADMELTKTNWAEKEDVA